jgi:hypothetical protein
LGAPAIIKVRQRDPAFATIYARREALDPSIALPAWCSPNVWR